MKLMTKSAFAGVVTDSTRKAIDVFVDKYETVYFRAVKSDVGVLDFVLYGWNNGKWDTMSVRSRGRFMREKKDIYSFSSVTSLPKNKKTISDPYNMMHHNKLLAK